MTLEQLKQNHPEQLAIALPLNFSHLLPEGSEERKYEIARAEAQSRAAAKAETLGLNALYTNSHNIGVGTQAGSFEEARAVAKNLGIDVDSAGCAESHDDLIAWARVDDEFVVGLIGSDWQARPDSHYVAVAYAPRSVMEAFFGRDSAGGLL